MRKASLFFFALAAFCSGCGDKSSPEEETASGDGSAAAPAPAAASPSNLLPPAIPPPPEISAAASQLLPQPPQPAPKSDHIPGGYAEARPVLENFLATTDWREQLKFCHFSSVRKEDIEAYYAQNSDGPIGRHHIRFLSMDETPADGDFPLYVFTLHIDAENNQFPVTIRKTPDGMKIDWEIFTEFRSRKFNRFVESGAGGPEVLRVILQRQSYWGDDKDEMAKHLSYRLTTMDPAVELFAFILGDSPLVETMNEFYGWGVGPIASTVEVERKPFPHGQSHFVITRLATHPLAGDGWHIKASAAD